MCTDVSTESRKWHCFTIVQSLKPGKPHTESKTRYSFTSWQCFNIDILPNPLSNSSRESPRFVGFVLWEPWMAVQDNIAVQPIAVCGAEMSAWLKNVSSDQLYMDRNHFYVCVCSAIIIIGLSVMVSVIMLSKPERLTGIKQNEANRTVHSRGTVPVVCHLPV